MQSILRDAFSLTRLSFWAGVLLSSLVGALLYTVTQRSVEQDAEERFVNHARQAQNVISVRIKSYTDLLRSAGSLLESADDVGPIQFHNYVRQLKLKENFPAVDTLNYGMYVTQDRRAAFETYLGKVVDTLVDRPVHAVITPPGARKDYLSTVFIEPKPTDPRIYGFDLLANNWVAGQIMASRDSGKMQASGTPIAALSSPHDVHLGIRMPIYRHGAPVATVEQRRAAYMGSLGIAFSVPKLLKGILDETQVPGMRMVLYDSGPRADAGQTMVTSRPRLLFDSKGTPTTPAPTLDGGDDMFTVTLPLDFGGRPWKTIYSVRKEQLYSGPDSYSPKVMMAFGFLGSVLLYAVLYMLTSSRRAALSIAQEMTRELRESQAKLELSHINLRRLANHAYQIKELERKRIAREIHDDLGQNLLALRIDAEMLAARTKGTQGQLHQRALATVAQIDSTIRNVRQIINDLRPTVLDLGLSAAVEWQVNQFQRRNEIACTLIEGHQEVPLADHCATAIFRILQESLTNIARHAHATKVVVELKLAAGWLTLMVKDNGCGLPPGGRNKSGSFGLVGIEERILILGGTCKVFSPPEGGTTVMVSVPVNAPLEPLQALEREFEPGPITV